ncbi:hypothetical protein V6Z11_D08G103900 [Gossypium hirsutum]
MASTAKAEGCPERGMKSRIKVDFQTASIRGSPPLSPNRVPKKFHLCHIQFQKVMCKSTQIPTMEGQSQKMCSKVSTAAKYRGKQASERSRRLYRLEKLGLKLRNIRHVVIFILEDSCKFHNLVKNGL